MLFICICNFLTEGLDDGPILVDNISARDTRAILAFVNLYVIFGHLFVFLLLLIFGEIVKLVESQFIEEKFLIVLDTVWDEIVQPSKFRPDSSVSETVIVIWQYFGREICRYSIVLATGGEAVWTKVVQDFDKKGFSEFLHHLFGFSKLHARSKSDRFDISCFDGKFPALLWFRDFTDFNYQFFLLVKISLPFYIVNYLGTGLVAFLKLACFAQ